MSTKAATLKSGMSNQVAFQDSLVRVTEDLLNPEGIKPYSPGTPYSEALAIVELAWRAIDRSLDVVTLMKGGFVPRPIKVGGTKSIETWLFERFDLEKPARMTMGQHLIQALKATQLPEYSGISKIQDLGEMTPVEFIEQLPPGAKETITDFVGKMMDLHEKKALDYLNNTKAFQELYLREVPVVNEEKMRVQFEADVKSRNKVKEDLQKILFKHLGNAVMTSEPFREHFATDKFHLLKADAQNYVAPNNAITRAGLESTVTGVVFKTGMNLVLFLDVLDLFWSGSQEAGNLCSDEVRLKYLTRSILDEGKPSNESPSNSVQDLAWAERHNWDYGTTVVYLKEEFMKRATKGEERIVDIKEFHSSFRKKKTEDKVRWADTLGVEDEEETAKSSTPTTPRSPSKLSPDCTTCYAKYGFGGYHRGKNHDSKCEAVYQRKFDDFKASKEKKYSKGAPTTAVIARMESELNELRDMFKGLTGTNTPESSRGVQGREHRSGNQYVYEPKPNRFGSLAESEDDSN